jgi:hypothetical protein
VYEKGSVSNVNHLFYVKSFQEFRAVRLQWKINRFRSNMLDLGLRLITAYSVLL